MYILCIICIILRTHTLFYIFILHKFLLLFIIIIYIYIIFIIVMFYFLYKNILIYIYFFFLYSYFAYFHTHAHKLSFYLSLSVIIFHRNFDDVIKRAGSAGYIYHSSYIAVICAGNAIYATALHTCWQGRDSSQRDTVVRERLDIYLCLGETSECIVSAWFRFWQAVPGTCAYTDALCCEGFPV